MNFKNTKARITSDGKVTVSDGAWTFSQTQNEKTDTLVNNFIDYDKDCSSILSEEFRESLLVKNTITQFDEICRNKSSCEIKFDLNLLEGKCLDHVLK